MKGTCNRMEICSKEKNGERKKNITESKINPFKQHILASVKHTRSGRLLSGSRVISFHLCSFCCASCSSPLPPFSLYCLPLRHLNILYVAWCCVRGRVPWLWSGRLPLICIWSTQQHRLLHHRGSGRQAHWLKTNQWIIHHQLVFSCFINHWWPDTVQPHSYILLPPLTLHHFVCACYCDWRASLKAIWQRFMCVLKACMHTALATTVSWTSLWKCSSNHRRPDFWVREDELYPTKSYQLSLLH